MRRMMAAIGIASAGILTMPTVISARPVSPRAFLVSATLSQDGKIVGTPALTTLAGQPATIEISVEGGALFRMVATPITRDGGIALTSEIGLSYGKDGKTYRRTQTSTVQLKDSERVMFSIAPPQGAEGGPMKVSVSAHGVN